MSAPAGHRDDAADALRAWAILGVVSIHAADLALSPARHQAVSAYFRWAVPAFIVLSACFTVASLRRRPETFWPFMRRRLLKIGIPFLAYSLFYVALTADFQRLTPMSALTRHFSGYGWAGQYFFIVLVQLLPVFLLLSRVDLGAKALTAALILGSSLVWAAPAGLHEHLILRQLSDRPLVYWLPYAVLGAFMARHEDRWRAWGRRVPRGLLPLVAVATPWLIVAGPAPMDGDSPYLLPSVLLTGFILVPSFLAGFDHPWPRAVTYLGRHTLVVFCLNPFFTGVVRQSGLLPAPSPDGPLLDATARTLALIAIITAACLLTGEALKRVGLRRLVL